MRTQLDAALPLVQILWRRETEGQVFDSPERRAALDQRLRSAISRIPDSGLRRHYGDALAEMRRALFRPQAKPFRSGGAWRPRGFAEAAVPLAETRSSALGSGALSAEDLRISLILATLCRYPALLERFEPDLDRVSPSDADQQALHEHLLRSTAQDEEALLQELTDIGLAAPLERLKATGHLRIAPVLSAPPDTDKAVRCLTEEFAKLHAGRARDYEIREALEDLEDDDEVDPRLNRRLNHAVQARIRATTQDDSAGAEQYGNTNEAIAAFHRLLNSAGEAKKRS
jgi:DNA primase